MCFLQLLICWFRWRAGDEIRPAPCSRNWRTLALSVHYRSGTLPLMNIETKTRLNWVASLLHASQAAVSFAASPPNTLTDSELQARWKLLFDGKTTTGWRSYKMDKMPPGWAVIDGALVRVKGGEGGKGAGGGDDIVTTEEFSRNRGRLYPGQTSQSQLRRAWAAENATDAPTPPTLFGGGVGASVKRSPRTRPMNWPASAAPTR